MKIWKDTVDGLVHEDPELGSILKRQRLFFYNTVRKVAAVTGTDVESVFQDILIHILKLRPMQGVPLYRYKGSLWEMRRCTEKGALLVTPRYITRKSKTVYAQLDEIEYVSKVSLEVLVFTRIKQGGFNLIETHYRVKNGFTKQVNKTESKRVGKKIYDIEQFAEVVSEDSLDSTGDMKFVFTPEDTLIFRDYIQSLRASLSDEAAPVLDMVLDNPKIHPRTVSRRLRIDLEDAAALQLEVEMRAREILSNPVL